MEAPTDVCQTNLWRALPVEGTDADGSEGDQSIRSRASQDVTPITSLFSSDRSHQVPAPHVSASRSSQVQTPRGSALLTSLRESLRTSFRSSWRTSLVQSRKSSGRRSSAGRSSVESHWLSNQSFGAIRKHVLDACKLPASEKLVAATVHTVTDDELRDLSDVLAQGGRIRTSDLQGYFSMSLQGYTDDDMDVLLANFGCGKDALTRRSHTSPAKFRENFRTEVVADLVRRCIATLGRLDDWADAAKVETALDREAFVEQVARHLAREDALKTLPTTCLLMILFIGLVIFHLKILERQQVETGIENWMNSYGPYDGPFIADTSDVDTFWSWLETSGVEAMFSDTRVATADVHGFSRVAAVNDVLGDAKISRHLVDGSSHHAWLRGVGRGAGSNSNSTTMFDEALAGMRELKSFGFLPAGDVSEIRLTFCTYDERARMFAIVELIVDMGVYGAPVVTMSAGAIIAQMYSSPVLMILFDCMYVVILLCIAALEGFDMLKAATSGWRGFLAYWGLWNIVDIMSIILGVVNMLVAYDVFIVKQADSFTQLYDESSGKLIADASALSPTKIQQILDDLGAIQTELRHLHYIVAINAASITLRFFKAFTANSRLHILAQTLEGCYEDMVHFLVIFVVIYLSFAITGHVVFGKDIAQFYTIASSANTALTSQLGEHDWYLKICKSDKAVLSSGMPVIMLHIWFVSYMLLVSLVMLNMLLAIILDSYTCAVGDLRKHHIFPTLLQQCTGQLEMLRKTWNFIPLHRIHDYFAHKATTREPPITTSSLCQNFSAMTPEQAEWLATWIGRLVCDDEEFVRDSARDSRQKRTCRSLEVAAEELAAMSGRLLRCQTGLESINGRIDVMEIVATSKADSIESPHWPSSARLFEEIHDQPFLKECFCQTEDDNQRHEVPNFLLEKRARVSIGRAGIERVKEDSRPVLEDDHEFGVPREPTRLRTGGRMCCFSEREEKPNFSEFVEPSWQQIQNGHKIVRSSPVALGEFTLPATAAGLSMEEQRDCVVHEHTILDIDLPPWDSSTTCWL